MTKNQKGAREVGIRELKARASEIVDEVREQQATYVITHRGQPVGMLVPFGDLGASGKVTESYDAAWDELDRIGEEIGRGWNPDDDPVELLSRMRR